jgi:hypothetical protein
MKSHLVFLSNEISQVRLWGKNKQKANAMEGERMRRGDVKYNAMFSSEKIKLRRGR